VIAVRTGHGVPPERTWAEWTGTHARPLDMLTGYRWPLAHPRLTLPFGPTFWGSRLVDGQPFHDGVDLATFCNDRVLAAHAGTVIAAGRHYDDVMGWVGSLKRYYSRLDHNHLWFQLPIVVVIDDGNGYRSMYAHMWRITVKKGDHVEAGQLIGNEGRTGRASGCHLHYGLFSPWETDTFRLKPDVAKRMQLPKAEIARVDPLKVLPKRAGINAPKNPKASATPTPAPEP
jgi:murein DD-endopeptidase MepM/ murein hydrolase activator NlpD